MCSGLEGSEPTRLPARGTGCRWRRRGGKDSGSGLSSERDGAAILGAAVGQEGLTQAETTSELSRARAHRGSEPQNQRGAGEEKSSQRHGAGNPGLASVRGWAVAEEQGGQEPVWPRGL